MTHDDAIRTLAAERYLLDEMSELERHEYEEHYFTCDECATDLRAAAALADGIRRDATPSGLPAAAAPRPNRVVSLGARPWTRTWIPLAAAASLAAVVGYQGLVTIPALRSRVAPRMVAPVVLTPTTRGEGPILEASSDSSPRVLSLDVTIAPPSGRLVYDVRTDTGRPVVAGQTPVPLPGTPLLLLLTEPLAPGTYEVTLGDAEGAGDRVSSYRFTVR